MHINAHVRRKRDIAAFEKHMWYNALGIRWKSIMGELPHMGILPRPTLIMISRLWTPG